MRINSPITPPRSVRRRRIKKAPLRKPRIHPTERAVTYPSKSADQRGGSRPLVPLPGSMERDAIMSLDPTKAARTCGGSVRGCRDGCGAHGRDERASEWGGDGDGGEGGELCAKSPQRNPTCTRTALSPSGDMLMCLESAEQAAEAGTLLLHLPTNLGDAAASAPLQPVSSAHRAVRFYRHKTLYS